MTTTILRRRSRRPTPTTVRPLFTRRQQRLFVRLCALLALAGAAAGVAALLRPAPLPKLVGLWILSDPSQHGQREAALANDRAALIDDKHFAEVSALPVGTPTLQQVQAQLASLSSLRMRDSVVLYVAGNASLDENEEVRLPFGSGAASESVPLRDVLTALRDSPARRKLLVLDLVRDDDDCLWPHAPGEIAAAVVKALAEIDDPRRRVLTACSPGQSPCVDEITGRTLFGASFERALMGDADGALDGRHDGRVSVAELAKFVADDVARRAAATQDAAQVPLAGGAGQDFDIAAESLRARRAPQAKAKPLAVRAYPKWLAAAWTTRDQMLTSRAFEHAPRTQCRWELALLRAEGQWRGGRAEKDVERDLTQQLATLTRHLQAIASAVPSPAPASLAELRPSVSPADAATAQKAVTDLSTNLAAKTIGLTTDKAAAVRAELVKAFLDATQKLDAGTVAIAIVDQLTVDNSPTLDDVQLADQLLRARQPQAQYVETLFVRRLAAALAIDPTLSPDVIVQSLRVLRQGSEATLSERSFGWTIRNLATAVQQHDDANFALLHPGLTPANFANEQFSAASRTYERVLTAGAAIDEAYRVYDEAMLRLPLACNRSEPTSTAQVAWLAAAQATCALGDFLQLPRPPGTANQATSSEVEQARSLALAVQTACAQVTRPWTGARLDRLLADASNDNATVSTWPALQRALLQTAIASDDRQKIWAAFDQLNVKLSNSALVATSDSVPLPERQAATDPLQPLRCELAMLQLGDASPARLAPLVSAIDELVARRRAGETLADAELKKIHHNLRAEYAPLLSGPASGDVWSQVRSASIVPPLRDVAWLDEVGRDPQVALRKAIEQVRWQWLSDEFAYLAHDDAQPLFSEFARRFGELTQLRENFVRFDLPQSLARPSAAAPQTQVNVAWSYVGISPQPSPRLQIFSPDAGIVAQLTTTNSVSDATTITLLAGPSGDTAIGRGVLLQLTAGDRTWHQPLWFAAGDGSPLDLLLSTTTRAVDAIGDTLRLRPATTPQPYYLFVKNPTPQPQQVIVEIAGVGQATVLAAANDATRVVLPPAAPQPGAPPTKLGGALDAVLRDAKTSQTLLAKNIPVEVVSPTQYVRVTETRFDPGHNGKNRLSITLAASLMPPGPPCIVELVLPAEQIPGFVGVTGGQMRGELLRDGTPLTLTAEGLQLIDGAEELGEFALNIDGVERAMTFAADFARRGDATTPRQVARPKIALGSADYVLAGPNYGPSAHVTQGPTTASIEVRVGQLQNGVLVSQLSQKVPTPRETIVSAAAASDGAIGLSVGVRDWQFALDATGVVGPRTVEAALVDAGGRKLAVAQQRVVFDGTPPESVTFFQLPLEAIVKAPLNLQVLAADSVSGIEKVFVFTGRPVNGQPPPGAKLIEATRTPNGGTWTAQLSPVKDLGPIDIGVQAVNRVGLATCTSETVKIVAELATAGGSIGGTVAEGPLPQPQITVELHDDKNAVIATVKTDGQGAYLFTGLKPGSYTVSAEKTSSQRKAQAAVAIAAGQAATVPLSLSL